LINKKYRVTKVLKGMFIFLLFVAGIQARSIGSLHAADLSYPSTREQRKDYLYSRLLEQPTKFDKFTASLAYFEMGDNTNGRKLSLAATQYLLKLHRKDQQQTHLFEMWPGLDLVLRHGDQLDQETKDGLKEIILHFGEYKDTTTSNLKLLGHVVRFLGGELYGEAAFDAAVGSDNVTHVTNDWRGSDPNARKSLLDFITTIAQSGVGEMASRPYLWKNMLPLVSLAQLSKDTEISQKAAMAYESALAQCVGFWLRGHLAMPTTRSYPDVLMQDPATGESMGLLWYHFGGDLAPAISNSGLRTAMMNPTVSTILELAGSDRSKSYYARGLNGNRWHYQAWMTPNYALFADSLLGPNSGQVYPNGVVWTDPVRGRYTHLWVTKPIQDDSKLYVSATHGKESRQFREAVARDVLLYVFDIIPPPATEPSPTPYAMGYIPGGYRQVVNEAAQSGSIFLHYGSVMIAIRSEIPFGWNPNSGITYPSAKPATGDSEFIIDGDIDTSRPPLTLKTPLKENFRFSVAIETASPSDYPSLDETGQLKAFQADIQSRSNPLHGEAPILYADYTSRHGDHLRLLFSEKPSDNPFLVNDNPFDYAAWPRIENPWINMSQGSDHRIWMRSPERREILDLDNWTRTILPGSDDTTPPDIYGATNIILVPVDPSPTLTFSITAKDAQDGELPVNISTTPSTVFTPGTTTVVSATARDSAFNQSVTTFTVKVLPFVPPPAPVSPWILSQIGNAPIHPGTAFHNPDNGLMMISGNAGTSGVGSTGGDLWQNNDNHTFVYLPWSSDNCRLTAHLTDFTSIDSGAKAGIMIRSAATKGKPYASIYLMRNGNARSQYRSSTSSAQTNVNFFSYGNDGRGVPEWIRLQRLGTGYSTFTSEDNLNWIQIGPVVDINMGSGNLCAGFFVSPRTGGQEAQVVFKHLLFEDLNISSSGQESSSDVGGNVNTSANTVEVSPPAPVEAIVGGNVSMSANTVEVSPPAPVEEGTSTSAQDSLQDLGPTPASELGLEQPQDLVVESIQDLGQETLQNSGEEANLSVDATAPKEALPTSYNTFSTGGGGCLMRNPSGHEQ
jgi:hypothetical protein